MLEKGVGAGKWGIPWRGWRSRSCVSQYINRLDPLIILIRTDTNLKIQTLFFSVFILLCDGGDIREIMLNFLDLGLLNGNYAFITVHLPKRLVYILKFEFLKF